MTLLQQWLINRVNTFQWLYSQNNRLLCLNTVARKLVVFPENVLWACEQLGIEDYHYCPYHRPLHCLDVRY